MRVYATQKIVQAASLLQLPIIDAKRLSIPKSPIQEVPATATTSARALATKAYLTLDMAGEYERQHEDSVLYALSQPNKSSLAPNKTIKDTIQRLCIAATSDFINGKIPALVDKSTNTSSSGEHNAYSKWKRTMWKLYSEDVDVDPRTDIPGGCLDDEATAATTVLRDISKYREWKKRAWRTYIDEDIADAPAERVAASDVAALQCHPSGHQIGADLTQNTHTGSNEANADNNANNTEAALFNVYLSFFE
jgi:hypothetical protein